MRTWRYLTRWCLDYCIKMIHDLPNIRWYVSLDCSPCEARPGHQVSVFVKTVKLHDNWELQLSVRSGEVIMCILQFVTKLNLSNLQLRNIRIIIKHSQLQVSVYQTDQSGNDWNERLIWFCCKIIISGRIWIKRVFIWKSSQPLKYFQLTGELDLWPHIYSIVW